MKISNEVKVGILAIAAISLLIWGYFFLKGKNLLSKTTIVYVEYENIDGLGDSDPVMVNGFKIGIVEDIYLKEDFSGNLMVKLNLDPKVLIPKKNVSANIVYSSIMGGKSVVLKYEGACDGKTCIQSGDTIPGKTIGMVASMTGDLDPYIEEAKGAYQTIDSTIRSMLEGDGSGDVDFKKVMKDFQATLANLNSTSARLNNLVARSTDDIDGTLSNLNALSTTLKNKNQQIDQIVDDVAIVAADLKKLKLNETVASVNSSLDDLDKTIKTIDNVAKEVKDVLAKANSTDGTLGMLINDKALYDNLNKLSVDLDLLAEDLRLNPKRYINLRRKNQEYTPNLNDPADTVDSNN